MSYEKPILTDNNPIPTTGIVMIAPNVVWMVNATTTANVNAVANVNSTYNVNITSK